MIDFSRDTIHWSVSPQIQRSVGQKMNFCQGEAIKPALINIISGRLRDKGGNVINCEGDSDCEIVHPAIAASQYGSTTLIGGDNDLFVLLLYSMKPDNKSLFFHSDKKSTNQIRVYNINKLKLLLVKPLCSQLLSIHSCFLEFLVSGKINCFRNLSTMTKI